MAGKIFISYRRDDAAGDARGIYEGLARRFGKSNVFMDVDSLLAGQRFDRELDKALASCAVLIAVIGPRWMELLAAKDASGDRHYVREEIAAALKRGIIVIPVRVGQAGRLPPLPRAADLPEDLRDLVLHHKHDVAHESFGRDLADLIAAIRVVRRGERPPLPRKAILIAAALVLLLTAGFAVVQFGVLEQVSAWQAARVSAQRAEAERVAEQGRVKAEAEKQRQEAEARATAEAENRRRVEEARQKAADEERRKREPALGVVPGSGQSFRDTLANGEPCPFCPELAVAPAGAFTMGSPQKGENGAVKDEEGRRDNEGPQHVVTLRRSFAVGKFEVTVDQFAAFVSTNKVYDAECEKGLFVRSGLSFRNPGFSQTGSHPAACVNWNAARAFVDWLSRQTGKPYRLLTEAEWEYAARGRTAPGPAPRFFFGDDDRAMCKHGNGLDQTGQKTIPGADKFAGVPCPDGYAYTAPVGSFSPNAFGLHDTHGNVWEWVEDCVHDNYDGAPNDGSAWTTGDCGRRVVRGGSWYDDPQGLRAAYRTWFTTVNRYFNLGFRVGRTLITP